MLIGRIVIIFVFLLSTAIPGYAQSSSPSIPSPSPSILTRAQQADMFMDFLKKEGYKPEKNEKGNLNFKIEGWSYTLIIYDKDKDFYYYELALPNLKPESKPNKQKILVAANHVTLNIKVAKVIVTPQDYVHATFEMFCQTPEELMQILLRATRILKSAANLYFDTLRKD
jgi:hypothetical protein